MDPNVLRLERDRRERLRREKYEMGMGDWRGARAVIGNSTLSRGEFSGRRQGRVCGYCRAFSDKSAPCAFWRSASTGFLNRLS